MADRLWNRLCGDAVPERYARPVARARADLAAAWDALPEADHRDLVAMLQAPGSLQPSGADLLARLGPYGSRLYRAASQVRGLQVLARGGAGQPAADGHRAPEPWGGAPLEYEAEAPEAAYGAAGGFPAPEHGSSA